MSSASARFAVLAAFWEDLSKVTLLRSGALILDSYLQYLALFGQGMRW
jgi:hypothetical protein